MASPNGSLTVNVNKKDLSGLVEKVEESKIPNKTGDYLGLN